MIVPPDVGGMPGKRHQRIPGSEGELRLFLRSSLPLPHSPQARPLLASAILANHIHTSPKRFRKKNNNNKQIYVYLVIDGQKVGF